MIPELRARLEALLPECLLADRVAARARMRRAGDDAARWRAVLERVEASHRLWQARRDARPAVRYPEALPITARAAEITAALQAHPVLVVAGETGSGKTTQLPKMCLEAGLGIAGKIACTQPRRVAALSVSQRIAEELGVAWGREVGAKIRFADRTHPETLIKMMTDGMLLAEIQGDPMLWEYEAIVIDEAHERSLNIDFLLGYLQTLRAKRPDLKIIVTSATIDTAAFSRAFDDAPVITVSGRTYPVEIRYEPVDEGAAERGDFTYLDAAARAVESVIAENHRGDLLVFLPGEKDIRELGALLEGRRLGRVEVLPLFGRLTNAEQQRIFAPTQARKIILATNIAETSLTIPGIGFVIDTGLARISRYQPRTHTRRLPIEPIAQSSANQRAGRAGRVSDGVCLRLYSEKDYASRPAFATPELQRANLAEVILRMITFGLGQVETFPFLDPPAPAAIRAGYQLLQDLNALDAERCLTPLGKELGRLPCDPTVGRMLLQARREGAVPEVLVIAAGLSIQDPRERPADAQEAADRMHARFRHEQSDFLTLLNIWDAYHEQMEALTQNQLRRFCREHFLSYLRMREWRDVHAQLRRVMQELGEKRFEGLRAEDAFIHRSLLAGLLGNIAHREAGNHYRGTHQREVMLHPGSSLFDRRAAKDERKKFKGRQKPSTVSGNRTPAWVMCAEWMETSRLFARVAAGIEPRWIEDLGGHVLQRSYVEPTYDEKGERAVVSERLHLYGLEIARRRVGYGRIDPAEARLIFIRAGLVAANLRTALPWYEENEAIRASVEEQQTRLRASSVWQLDERMEAFYTERLPAVSSVVELRKWWREADETERARLRLTPEDLLEARADDLAAYPEAIEIEGVRLALDYHYKPGDANDGATLRVPFGAFGKLDPARLDWAVPGYVRERISHLLKGLPKETRRRLHPLAETAAALAEVVQPSRGALQEQLTRLIGERFGVRIWPDEWDDRSVPAHLRARVEVIDAEERVVAEGRAWEEVAEAVEAARQGRAPAGEAERSAREQIWQAARARWERHDLRQWSFPDLPAVVEIGQLAEVPVEAWPGLQRTPGDELHLRLFPSPEAAARATEEGFPALLERALAKELGWMEKELPRELKRVKLETIGWLEWDDFVADAVAHGRAYALAPVAPRALRRELFEAACTVGRERLRGWVPRFVDTLEPLLVRRRAMAAAEDPHGIREATLDRLMPVDFLAVTPWDRLTELGRYLEAAERRAEKARRDPARDVQRYAEIARLERALAGLKRASAARERLRWALEEWRVSVFAQELGSRERVSPKILNQALAEARAADEPFPAAPGAVAAPAEPIRAAAPPRSVAAPRRPPEARDLEALKRLWEQ